MKLASPLRPPLNLVKLFHSFSRILSWSIIACLYSLQSIWIKLPRSNFSLLVLEISGLNQQKNDNYWTLLRNYMISRPESARRYEAHLFVKWNSWHNDSAAINKLEGQSNAWIAQAKSNKKDQLTGKCSIKYLLWIWHQVFTRSSSISFGIKLNHMPGLTCITGKMLGAFHSGIIGVWNNKWDVSNSELPFFQRNKLFFRNCCVNHHRWCCRIFRKHFKGWIHDRICF